MTKTAPSFRPAWATVVWVDNTHIFTELPSREGPPLIQKYPLSEAGFSKAIALMRDIHRQMQPAGGNYKIEVTPTVSRSRVKPKGSPEQRARAAAILKKMGIT